jgi:periplasmic divalent cation tolerance protein
MKFIVVFTTVGSEDEARVMARSLVERKLAACAQISSIESVYEWDGALQNDREFRLTLKTVEERYPAVEQAIRELHSYDLPAIHALPVTHIHGPYAEWVAKQCAVAMD